jgi:S-adenosylmethionine hydrolase
MPATDPTNVTVRVMDPSLSRPIITLTTDFGSDSSYAAQMKGVILSRNPDVQIVDICHGIAPQDIRSGAIVLADVCHRFPAHTIHVAVVDPGVGTDRQIVFAQFGAHCFIAPDNGLLTLVAQRTPPSQLIAVTKRTYFLPEVSPTFHGRDILSPVAAHLSLGLNPKRLGKSIASLTLLAIPKPVVETRRIVGQVIQIDSFGNLITNILAEDLAEIETPESVSVRFGEAAAKGIVATYGHRATGTLTALVGSTGRLELAIVNGSAASALSARLDDPVVISW